MMIDVSIASTQEPLTVARPPAPLPRIRVGVGGWLYEPWRDNYYPAGLPHKRELEYSSRRLTAIEIDSTYYRDQKPATFAKWRDETPDLSLIHI